jgi:hypothetical protein
VKKIFLILMVLLHFPIMAEQVCKDSITASTHDSNFIVNGGEVTDTTTGLIWQKCSLGQFGSNCEPSSPYFYTKWTNALLAAQAHSQQTGLPWRLPNVRELRSIVEERCYQPAINLSIFPNTPSWGYWTASPSATRDSDWAWGVRFDNGESSQSSSYSGRYVRLVRSGQ